MTNTMVPIWNVNGVPPDLPQFNPESIQPQELQLIQAPRNQGKSTTLFHLMFGMAPKIVTPVVISHTEEDTHFFETKCKIPRQFIHYKFNESILTNALDRGRKLQNSPPPGYSFDLHGATHLFLEDCLDDKKLFRNDAMNTFTLNGRHKGVGATILSQYLACITKENRSQFDRVVCLYDESLSNRKFLHENCFGGLAWDHFQYYYSKYTANHGCLIYSKNQKYGPRYSYFRADQTLLDNYHLYQMEWSPYSTVHNFCKNHPLITNIQQRVDWNKAERGLSQLLPGMMPTAKSRRR